MKIHSAEVQRLLDELEQRLPECLANVKRGPEARKFNTAGYQIFRDEAGDLVFNAFTETQKDLLYWGRQLGLCDHTGDYRHQEFLIEELLNISASTGDPNDVLHKVMIHVTTDFDLLLMDKDIYQVTGKRYWSRGKKGKRGQIEQCGKPVYQKQGSNAWVGSSTRITRASDARAQEPL